MVLRGMRPLVVIAAMMGFGMGCGARSDGNVTESQGSAATTHGSFEGRPLRLTRLEGPNGEVKSIDPDSWPEGSMAGPMTLFFDSASGKLVFTREIRSVSGVERGTSSLPCVVEGNDFVLTQGEQTTRVVFLGESSAGEGRSSYTFAVRERSKDSRGGLFPRDVERFTLTEVARYPANARRLWPVLVSYDRQGDYPLSEKTAALKDVWNACGGKKALDLLADVAVSYTDEALLAACVGHVGNPPAMFEAVRARAKKPDARIHPAVLARLLVLGARTPTEATAWAFSLLDDNRPWLRLAGHVALGLMTLQPKPPFETAMDLRDAPPETPVESWKPFRTRPWNLRRVLRDAILSQIRSRKASDGGGAWRQSGTLRMTLRVLEVLEHPHPRGFMNLDEHEIDAFLKEVSHWTADGFSVLQSAFPIAELIP